MSQEYSILDPTTVGGAVTPSTIPEAAALTGFKDIIFGSVSLSPLQQTPSHSIKAHSLCVQMAGIIGKTIEFPFDTVKVRSPQTQRSMIEKNLSHDADPCCRYGCNRNATMHHSAIAAH